jgi:C4-dicarboxylate-specific signal transduction histidine kinase
VARPLREQFAVATLVLLVPVSLVMTWAAGTTYNEQVRALETEATLTAATIAAHLDRTTGLESSSVQEFIAHVPVPEGATIVVLDRSGRTVASWRQPGDTFEEQTHGSAQASRANLSVTVGLPTSFAWWQAGPIYRRMIAIAVIATLMMLAFELLFLRRWRRSIGVLEQRAERVGAGDLAPPPPAAMASSEMDQLRDVFDGMVANVRDARESIARQIEEERQMRATLESLQQQIIRQERLAAIGVLLSGIAHELNNPLQAISGFAELLQREPDLTPSVRSDLGIIKKESGRASAIIRNLSRFCRQQGPAPTLVYVRDVVESVVELRQRRFQEIGIALEVDEQASQAVRAVFTELQQVLLNFVINAEQAMATCPVDERRLIIRTRDLLGGVAFEVEDTGPGVAHEDEGKLFQPFFTTKPVGEGTGLGLSVSYGIVRTCGGTIGYRRAPHGGAIFSVELPEATDVRAHA